MKNAKDKAVRSADEIRRRIKEIEADKRMLYPTATVFENAPLALIQLEGETTITALRWVLRELAFCAGSYPTDRCGGVRKPRKSRGK